MTTLIAELQAEISTLKAELLSAKLWAQFFREQRDAARKGQRWCWSPANKKFTKVEFTPDMTPQQRREALLAAKTLALGE